MRKIFTGCFGVNLLSTCLITSAATGASPAIIDYSGNVTLYVQGVYLGGGALLTYRHMAEADFIIARADGKWRELSFPKSALGARAAFTAIDDHTWLARHGETTWLSSDKGLSWSEVAAPSLVLRSDAVAIAELGRLGALKWDSKTARLSWEGPTDLMVDDFTSVSAISNLAAVAAVRFTGKYGTETFGLVKTQDGGRHWEWLVKEGAFSFDPSGNYLAHHVFFLTLQSGWISSDYLDDVYHTADGGKTWDHIKAPDRVTSALYFKNGQEGLVIGGSTARIYETRDGGTNWRELTDSEVLSPSFIEYFADVPECRWNDFAVYRLVLAHR